ncbi:MAG: hypothetical protein EA353_04980 [Puniceicoccaceae bacterium]|nr:MAG: hypothetical protein EA353_04980 [Puniceicoccaceae bacterium]
MQELRVLLNEAKKHENNNLPLYEALCRSSSVLLASHLEGFVKDITKSVRNDLNYNLKEFKNMPAALKREFAKKISTYDGVPQPDLDKRARQIIAFFDDNHVPIDFDAFTVKEIDGKNPSLKNIEQPFSKFGVGDVLSAVDSAYFLQVFEGSPGKTHVLLREMKRCRSTLHAWPYKSIDEKRFSNPITISVKKKKQQSLWVTFVEEIVTRRHKIAHGESLLNLASSQELDVEVNKVEILMNGLLYYFCGTICKQYRTENKF